MPSTEPGRRRGALLLAALLAALAFWTAGVPRADAQGPPLLDIDRTFAPPTGIARDGQPGLGADVPGGVAVHGDRIYTAGESSGEVAIVARRATGGGLDPGFAGDGRIDIALGNGRDVATAIVVLPDGRLRVLASTDADPAPSSTNIDVALVGLNADGSDDASFGGGDGRVSFPVGAMDDMPSRMVADAAGRLGLIGYSKDANGKEDAFVSLRNPDGSPNTAFDGDGIRVLDRAGGAKNDRGTDIAFAPGGGVIALLRVATSADANVNDYVAALHAFRPDGQDDSSFSGDGDLVLSVGDPNTIPSGLIAHKGRYWATGSTKGTEDTDAFIARVDADGSGFQFRRFDLRGAQLATTERVVSSGGDLDVLGGASDTLVVVGSTTYNSRNYWSAAAFSGIDGDLGAAGYGDLLVPTEEYGALLGVAAGNGWLAATGSLLNVSGFDTSFGTVRLLTGTRPADAAPTLPCDLAIDVPSPLEIVASRGRPAPVELRVTNRGTAPCGGAVSVAPPYTLRAGSATGPLQTGPVASGATWAASASVTYDGPLRRDDAVAFEVRAAADGDPRNNRKSVRAVFPYCDLQLRAVGRLARLPTEGRRSLEFAVTNNGSAECAGVRLTVERPWRIHRPSRAYTIAPGRTVSDVVSVGATSPLRGRAALRVRVHATGDVDAGNDVVALRPALVRVGDSRIARVGARGLAGIATGGRASGMARSKLRVARVDVAVVRRVGKRCTWLRSADGRFGSGSCSRPLWLRARGTERWSYRLTRALPRAGYRAYSRAVLGAGYAEAAFTQRDGNVRAFRIR